MVSSGILRRVALVRTDVSEEFSDSIRVTRIGELGTTLAVTSNVRWLLVTASVVPSSPILVADERGVKFLRNVGSYKATRRNIPEETILLNKVYLFFTTQTKETV
jgi:hypothetical protein